ncbi:MAG: hypothetical protein H6619_05300 [Deltaproteobacteria bacterium]|nr:hypothetical protein [Deltaproteobacteria bacterium]
MKIGLLYLHIVLLCVFIISNVVPAFMPSELSLDLQYFFSLNDSESRLATDRKVLLHKADMYELELVSGISDSTAEKILAKKDEIIRDGYRYDLEKKHLAFTKIKGIGAKKAEKFYELIDPR